MVIGIFNAIYPEPKNADDLDRVFLEMNIQEYLRLALLFVSAIVIAKKITVLTYWKIALALVGIIVLNYHLAYSYEAIDYYLIKGLRPQPEKHDLKSLLTLISFEPTPPSYEPVNHLLNWQLLFDGPFAKISLIGIVHFLFYGSISRVLWISAIVYFFFRKRRQKVE